MEYRSLGRTGMKVSAYCLGCMMFGSRTSDEESIRIIGRALEAGVNFLDTANVYSRGTSEEVVGKALKQYGSRDQVVLATKVHGRMDDVDPNGQGNHRRHIIEQCEASLRRLQTDRIDLYQIHRPQPDVPIDETLRALDDLVRAGKVRYIGTSTFPAWEVVESLWASKEYGLNRFVCEQPPYNLLDRRIERELVPMSQSYGLALIPWSPLAGGLLTGKYTRSIRPADSRWSHDWPGGPELNRAAYDVFDRVAEIAEEKQCTPSQLSLAWCAQRPGVVSPIIGPRTVEQLDDNLGACAVTLTESELNRLDQVAPPGGVTVPYYQADFSPPRYRW